MPWTLNKNGVRPDRDLTNAEQENLNHWMGLVQNGTHPRAAAQTRAGTYDYKKLGDNNQYQIRLSGGNRATFTVDQSNEVVTMLQVGGHT